MKRFCRWDVGFWTKKASPPRAVSGPALPEAILTEAAPVFALFEGRGFSAAESHVYPF
jgi:hypothetical protein